MKEVNDDIWIANDFFFKECLDKLTYGLNHGLWNFMYLNIQSELNDELNTELNGLILDELC